MPWKARVIGKCDICGQRIKSTCRYCDDCLYEKKKKDVLRRYHERKSMREEKVRYGFPRWIKDKTKPKLTPRMLQRLPAGGKFERAFDEIVKEIKN